MLEINEYGHYIKFVQSIKMSISSAADILNIFIDGKPYIFAGSDLNFNSTDILDDDLLIGQFTLSGSIVLSVENSLYLQRLYLDWESEQLQRKYITFSIPTSKSDDSGGVAPYHPYFTAIVNKLSRCNKNFDLKGFGRYLSDVEMKFVHQYCSFHPELRTFIKLRNALSSPDRTLIPCGIFELVVDSALTHVEGQRDKTRFGALYKSRNIKANESRVTDDFDFNCCKLMMDFDHVLDSPSIWREKLDFLNLQSSGGFLDILNLPF